MLREAQIGEDLLYSRTVVSNICPVLHEFIESQEKSRKHLTNSTWPLSSLAYKFEKASLTLPGLTC